MKLDLKEWIAKSSDYTASNQLAMEWKTITFGSCKNQTDYSKSLDVTKTGYAPLGVIGWSILGSWRTHFTITRMEVVNWTTLWCDIRSTNATSFTTDNTQVKALVLYVGGGST